MAGSNPDNSTTVWSALNFSCRDRIDVKLIHLIIRCSYICYMNNNGGVLTSFASSGSPWLTAENRIMYCVAPAAAPQLTVSEL